MAMETNALSIYLNDHLAGSVAASELARRCRSNNEGTPLGEFLDGFTAEIDSDRNALDEIMARVGARKDPVKQAAGWLAEKVGRLKPNGMVFGYSDLSRLEELEGLCLGVEGKLSLWKGLRAAADPRIDPGLLAQLEQRAKKQRTQLERHRLRAVAVAFDARGS
jgi:hypothetical protein